MKTSSSSTCVYRWRAHYHREIHSSSMISAIEQSKRNVCRSSVIFFLVSLRGTFLSDIKNGRPSAMQWTSGIIFQEFQTSEKAGWRASRHLFMTHMYVCVCIEKGKAITMADEEIYNPMFIELVYIVSLSLSRSFSCLHAIHSTFLA
jgi:hypothetical protein